MTEEDTEDGNEAGKEAEEVKEKDVSVVFVFSPC